MSFAIERRAWCDEAEQGLRNAARGDMAVIRAEVQQGVSFLWRITGGSDGWLVTREEGAELVIVVGEGRNCRPVVQHCQRLADAAGMSIRVHLTHPSLMKIYQRLGFVERERVFGYGR